MTGIRAAKGRLISYAWIAIQSVAKITAQSKVAGGRRRRKRYVVQYIYYIGRASPRAEQETFLSSGDANGIIKFFPPALFLLHFRPI